MVPVVRQKILPQPQSRLVLVQRPPALLARKIPSTLLDPIAGALTRLPPKLRHLLHRPNYNLSIGSVPKLTVVPSRLQAPLSRRPATLQGATALRWWKLPRSCFFPFRVQRTQSLEKTHRTLMLGVVWNPPLKLKVRLMRVLRCTP